MSDQTTHRLQERVKELTLLHTTARLLQNHDLTTDEMLSTLVQLLPSAWQYPEIAGARIQWEGREYRTANFVETRWMQRAEISVDQVSTGTIEVCYIELRPESDEGPFLSEERDLIESLSELIRLHIRHRKADEALRTAQIDLEAQVAARTRELETANRELQRQIEEFQQSEEQRKEYQRQLGRLSLELSMTEARERREIAADLHDHIGQALAFVKIKMSQFRGDAVFCGFEDTIGEIARLLDQTIAYTRNLTLQISPPVLYEFGLIAALEWLTESFSKEHRVEVAFQRCAESPSLSPEVSALVFKSVKELMTNVVRHSGGTRIVLSLCKSDGKLHITVADNGRGCDPSTVFVTAARSGRFGLFSVRERMRSLGGELEISSPPGMGTTVELCIPELPK